MVIVVSKADQFSLPFSTNLLAARQSASCMKASVLWTDSWATNPSLQAGINAPAVTLHLSKYFHLEIGISSISLFTPIFKGRLFCKVRNVLVIRVQGLKFP
jgi:hypothetical protein